MGAAVAAAVDVVGAKEERVAVVDVEDVPRLLPTLLLALLLVLLLTPPPPPTSTRATFIITGVIGMGFFSAQDFNLIRVGEKDDCLHALSCFTTQYPADRVMN